MKLIFTIVYVKVLMLNVITNTLPKNRRKIEDFENVQWLLRWERRSKRTEERRQKIFSKQNSVRRGRHGSGYSPLPSLSNTAGRATVFRRAERAAFFHGVIQTIGKTPLTTANVQLMKRRRFLDSTDWQKYSFLQTKLHQNRWYKYMRKAVVKLKLKQ